VVCYGVYVCSGGPVWWGSVWLEDVFPVLSECVCDELRVSDVGVIYSEVLEGGLGGAPEFVYLFPELSWVCCSVGLCFLYGSLPVCAMVYEKAVNDVLSQCLEVSLDAEVVLFISFKTCAVTDGESLCSDRRSEIVIYFVSCFGYVLGGCSNDVVMYVVNVCV